MKLRSVLRVSFGKSGRDRLLDVADQAKRRVVHARRAFEPRHVDLDDLGVGRDRMADTGNRSRACSSVSHDIIAW